MANINGIDPPPLNDQDYVNKIINSFMAVDNHDHTAGKGLPITGGAIQNGSVNLATKVTGVLPVANGGTGSATQNFVGIAGNDVIDGIKLFDAVSIFNNFFRLSLTTDNTSGVINDLSASGQSVRALTMATEIRGIANTDSGRVVILINRNSAPLKIRNQHSSATAANRIITGIGKDFDIGAGGMCLFLYDSVTQRWRVIGGVGAESTAEFFVKSEAELDLAIAGLAGGGVIQVVGSFTITGTKTLPNGTILQGLGPKTVITCGTAGQIVVGERCVIRDIGIQTTLTGTVTLISAAGSDCEFSRLYFNVASAEDITCLSVSGDRNLIFKSEFIGVVGGNAIGIDYVGGSIDNFDEYCAFKA